MLDTLLNFWLKIPEIEQGISPRWVRRLHPVVLLIQGTTPRPAGHDFESQHILSRFGQIMTCQEITSSHHTDPDHDSHHLPPPSPFVMVARYCA